MVMFISDHIWVVKYIKNNTQEPYNEKTGENIDLLDKKQRLKLTEAEISRLSTK